MELEKYIQKSEPTKEQEKFKLNFAPIDKYQDVKPMHMKKQKQKKN